MSGNLSGEYWDTCVFLAYINREVHRNGEAEEIDNRVRLFENGSLNLFTSTITITELYEAGRFDEPNRKTLNNIFHRTNFQFIEANRQVCNLASDIRSYFKLNPVKGKYPTTPDAIQVASAIAVKKHGVDGLNLITLDSNNKAKELAFIDMAPYIKQAYGVNITRPDPPGLFR
ncbi:PIN domain-containing protein [Nitrosomonas sp. Nm34]|uniref:type II toxin-antitoxin system VapC family toxin n=1 Tax=Nitrosomonas sp. Nm34 TaxID=1881055 RepID=UPI0008F259BE|nr:PIN domain-containing protein [Nitrosomonas sp. Nm34]SFI30939.1 PIN domain-containing protein [Nitrosomonas sp. Nm34]